MDTVCAGKRNDKENDYYQKNLHNISSCQNM